MQLRRTVLAGTVSALTVCAAVLPQSAAAAPVPGTNVAYTTDADFDKGTLTDVNHAAPNSNQLQLNKNQTPFPFVNVAVSGQDSVVRIDVNTGDVIGAWRSAPIGRGGNPSRTTVDRRGNVWVANRDEGEGGSGSVTRIGVVSGGTRVNADGSANASGDHLKPPFAYNTCADRNGDGLIATSRGLGDVRPWTNAEGLDTDGGVDTAADECIINYTRVTGTNARTVAVDAENDVWVGGADRDHEKLSGQTGQPIAGTQFNAGCGGYGGLVDKAGTLWSALYGDALLRYVPTTKTHQCLDFSHGDYGLGMDPVTGEIWHTTFGGNAVVKLAADGSILGRFSHGNNNAQGVAVDRAGNVWVAHSLSSGTATVGHLRTDGTYVGNVSLPGGDGPTGVAVDANGKIWVTNVNSNNVMRIDPAGGAIGGGGHRIGAVDFTVALGAGAAPYNYSDMTGSVLGEVTAPQGSWSVVQDSSADGATWGKVSWNTEAQGSVPAGTSLTVEARTSDSEAGLATATFGPVTNGGALSLKGRFIEVRVTMTSAANGASPVLSDLRVEGSAPASTDCHCVEGKGWITSPKDAYLPGKPNGRKHHSAKASFDFIVRSGKGGPKGVLEFRLDAADLKFRSSSVKTLAVSGRKAVFTGEGTLNHKAGYRYLVSLVDGDRRARTHDTFRIKIWDAATGEVRYDSQRGAADDAAPTARLCGGSVSVR